jgi:hypothetical protein
VKHRFRNRIKEAVALSVAGIYCDSNLLNEMFCTRVKKIMKLQKEYQKGMWKIYRFNVRKCTFYGRSCFAFGCKSGIVEVKRKK